MVFWMRGVGDLAPRLPLLDGLMKATQKEVVDVGHGGRQVDREVEPHPTWIWRFEPCKSFP